MINFNFSQISNSFSIFSFNYLFNQKTNFQQIVKPENTEIKEIIQQKRDVKTTLSGSKIKIIENLNEDVVIYFFIQKEQTTHSAWNLVLPIAKGLKTNKIILFSLGNFALQGSGGGLNSTKSIFYSAKKLKEKGFQVLFSPKVINNNNLLNEFLFLDSNLTLDDLDKNSITLYNYEKDIFEEILKQYNTIEQEYGF